MDIKIKSVDEKNNMIVKIIKGLIRLKVFLLEIMYG